MPFQGELLGKLLLYYVERRKDEKSAALSKMLAKYWDIWNIMLALKYECNVIKTKYIEYSVILLSVAEIYLLDQKFN